MHGCYYYITLCMYILGLKFWRVPSRKVYAVKEKNLRSVMKGKFPADTSTSSSDSDCAIPKAKRKTDISRDIRSIKSSLCTLFAVEKTMRVPLALRSLLVENFRCSICHDIIRPPAIYSRCCKYLIGCEVCIDRWYEGDGGRNKTCPRCRSERAFAETSRVNGIDDFLASVKDILEASGSSAP